ncbi:D-alanyl-D-alanine carboxypeptidase family protein [Pararhizobium sp.]|uniref:D-alanyl-D-alanine carboxypeptidase family protein n=1 Tax=Pararhizobium sp. TaxID=1977563 RepID=UPI00271E7380|nr:D-alanyl-D-alanine carboxypeptidase family protein [Pararhizobium sp.]MDO9418570.1 D-alanyl-D-alanine carboxypeptidase family protein [Pararhizobium sp.]
MRLCRFLLSIACAGLIAVPVHAQNQPAVFEPKAQQLFMVEAETNAVLFSKNENVAIAPASLIKLMTLEVVFDALKTGEIRLDTAFKVSEYAWRTGGAPSGTATMFAALKSDVSVESLIRGVAVQGANDACIILAEGLSGTEPAFVERMNKRAKVLGLRSAVFANSSGLPDPKNRISLRDLVVLARHIETTYPDYFKYYAEAEFEWNKIKQRNRNPLIALNIGVDGLGSGFAEGAGFSIVTSMKRDGKQILLAMGGLTSDKERTEEAKRVLEWANSSFSKKKLFEAGEAVGDASVYGGDRSSLPVVVSEPVDVFIATNNPERLSARVIYKWPLTAPVAAGQTIGVLKISSGERLLREVPVKASEAAGVGSLSARALDAVQELLFFWL